MGGDYVLMMVESFLQTDNERTMWRRIIKDDH